MLEQHNKDLQRTIAAKSPTNQDQLAVAEAERYAR